MNLTLLFVFLVCVSGDSCRSNSDCLDFNSCVNKVCVHKGLIPLEPLEYIGSVVMILVSIIANAGGVGGSAMTISLILLFFNFDTHSSVALTQVFIFAGTTTVTILKFRDRHPTRDRPLIYYDALMQISSPIVAGVTIGTMVNQAFPSWLILGLLTIIVFFLVWDASIRSLKIYRKENEIHKVAAQDQIDERSTKTMGKVSSEFINQNGKGENIKNSLDEVEEEEKANHEEEEKEDMKSEEINIDENKDNSADSGAEKSDNISVIEDSTEHRSKEQGTNDPVLLRRITTIYQEEQKIIAWIPLFYFSILVGSSILFSLLKGGAGSPSLIGISGCSPQYFSLIIGYFGFMLFLNLLASFYLVRKTDVCLKTNYVFDEGDVQWNYYKCAWVSLGAVIAGIVVGLLGMGGGNLIGPMLLSLGVRPEISTVSSSFTIFISSGIASAQYFISGLIDFYYAAFFFGLSIIGSLLGILVLRRYAIRKQRISLLIICLAIIMAISLVIIPTVGIITFVKQYNQGVFQLGFVPLC